MNRTTASLPLAILLSLATLGSSCGDDSPTTTQTKACSGTTGTYYLTPSSAAAYTVTDKYGARTVDADFFNAGCDAICYNDCPDETNDSFRYATGANCAANWFDAFVGDYTFTGTWVRAYDTGTGPFATGTYGTSGGENGTFEFYEEGRTKP